MKWKSALFNLMVTTGHRTIVLNFDGSLRHPFDPGLPTSTLGRMAACATCLTVNDEVVLLGGRILPATSLSTSGEVEYEGLLLGLTGLRSFLDTSNQLNQSVDCSEVRVTIKGDCKTVVEQMKATAKPRKLEDYHRKAVAFIRDELPPFCRISFLHVNRQENWICDSLSACMLSELQNGSFQNSVRELANLLTMIDSQHETGQVAEEPRTSTITSSMLDRLFGVGLSLIPLSKRPQLYRCMAHISFAENDFVTLLAIGKNLQLDVESIKSLGKLLSQNDDWEKLLVEALTYQIVAFESSGRTKDASVTTRKYRWILDRIAEVADHTRDHLSSDHHSVDGLQKELTAYQHQNNITNEWPLLVEKWYDEAVQSNDWKQDKRFWYYTDQRGVTAGHNLQTDL